MNPKQTSILGIAAVSLFVTFFIVFGLFHPDFNFLTDYISKLGYRGTLLTFWWNLLGFGIPGVLFTFFGFSYGRILNDKLAGVLLSIFGIGFTFTAIPFDTADQNAQVSTIHVLAITLGLASWLFGLARIGYNKSLEPSIIKRANIAAGFLGVFMIGSLLDLWSEPIAQRLVFLIVFSWTLLSSLSLIKNKE